jgi:sialate O-acetylesterase
VLETARVEGSRIRLKFRTPGNEALKITGAPAGFVIAGADRKFVEAKGELAGPQTIDVWSYQVAEPAAVRYAWSQRGIFRVYTESGLPLGPFRTDDWVIPESEIRD